jgi:thiol-disulfide isomerase/thioredoxin
MEIKRRSLIYIIILIGAFVGGYFVYNTFFAPEPTSVTGIQLGDKVLDQKIPNIDGSSSVNFSDYRGNVLIIDFMAPWCEPCRAQISILRDIELINGVEVITINIDPNYDMEFLMNFKEDEGIHWFFGHYPPSALNFEVTAIPTIIIVDQNGKIVHRAYFTTINDFEIILSSLID